MRAGSRPIFSTRFPMPGMRPSTQAQSGGAEWSSDLLPTPSRLPLSTPAEQHYSGFLNPPIAVNAQSFPPTPPPAGPSSPFRPSKPSCSVSHVLRMLLISQHQQNSSRWAFQTPAGVNETLGQRACVRACVFVCVCAYVLECLATYTLPWMWQPLYVPFLAFLPLVTTTGAHFETLRYSLGSCHCKKEEEKNSNVY